MFEDVRTGGQAHRYFNNVIWFDFGILSVVLNASTFQCSRTFWALISFVCVLFFLLSMWKARQFNFAIKTRLFLLRWPSILNGFSFQQKKEIIFFCGGAYIVSCAGESVAENVLSNNMSWGDNIANDTRFDIWWLYFVFGVKK